MTNVASKNPYDLLGNDPEQDEDRAPEPPTKVIDKPVGRTGKRNAGADGATGGIQRGGGRGGMRGDQAGSYNDRAEKRDDGNRESNRTREPREHRGGDRGGRGRGRGERGERGEGRGRGFSGRFQRTNRDDRADHTGIGSHDKQAAQGWGDEKSGTAEWNDEKAGDEIARAESKDEPGFTPDTSAGDPAFTNGPGAPGEIVDENAAPEEPEDKTKSYDEYLAEQAEKRLALGNDSLSVRKANEGSKQKFPEGTVASRNAAEENFFEGSGGKTKREKTNQQGKQTVQLEGQYYNTESNDRGGDRGRGGRGRGRGGPRGEFRGDRGDRGDRPDRGGRGEYRGDRGDRGEHRGRGRGRGDRGEFRGAPRGDRGDRGDRPDRSDRGGSRGGFNATDQSAFPALGGS